MGKRTLSEKTALAIGVTAMVLLVGGISLPAVYSTIQEDVRKKMQARQDTIVKNLNYNPLTRISSPEDFQRLYELEQQAYDSLQSPD